MFRLAYAVSVRQPDRLTGCDIKSCLVQSSVHLAPWWRTVMWMKRNAIVGPLWLNLQIPAAAQTQEPASSAGPEKVVLVVTVAVTDPEVNQ